MDKEVNGLIVSIMSPGTGVKRFVNVKKAQKIEQQKLKRIIFFF